MATQESFKKIMCLVCQFKSGASEPATKIDSGSKCDACSESHITWSSWYLKG
jgi:hypothetical protein